MTTLEDARDVPEALRLAAHLEGFRSFPDDIAAAAMLRKLHAKVEAVRGGWRPIETAPKDKTLLLGYRNSHGHWRTLRGEWFTQEEIDEYWEDPDGVEPGWFETSVEADDVPNVWRTEPTHWQPLPTPPAQEDGNA